MKRRWRMQSVRTGWGVEAACTAEGKASLEKLRRAHPDKFKWCRTYEMIQTAPEAIKELEPFQLTQKTG